MNLVRRSVPSEYHWKLTMDPAVDLIRRQRREIDELREQALNQRMLNQYPQDAEVRDRILRYQRRITELQERLGM